jgi:hypothetical protein
MKRILCSLSLCFAILGLISCSSTGEVIPDSFAGPGRGASLSAYSDNPCRDRPEIFSLIDSYAPCTIYYMVSTASRYVSGGVQKIEVSLDDGAWEDVTSWHPIWLSEGENIHNLQPEQLLQVTITDPGPHWFSFRVVYADGVVIERSSQTSNPGEEFTVYALAQSST